MFAGKGSWHPFVLVQGCDAALFRRCQAEINPALALSAGTWTKKELHKQDLLRHLIFEPNLSCCHFMWVRNYRECVYLSALVLVCSWKCAFVRLLSASVRHDF